MQDARALADGLRKITNFFPFHKGFFEIILKTKTHLPNTNLPDKLVWAGISKTPPGSTPVGTAGLDPLTLPPSILPQ